MKRRARLAARKALAVFVSVVLVVGLMPNVVTWGEMELQEEAQGQLETTAYQADGEADSAEGDVSEGDADGAALDDAPAADGGDGETAGVDEGGRADATEPPDSPEASTFDEEDYPQEAEQASDVPATVAVDDSGNDDFTIGPVDDGGYGLSADSEIDDSAQDATEQADNEVVLDADTSAISPDTDALMNAPDANLSPLATSLHTMAAASSGLKEVTATAGTASTRTSSANFSTLLRGETIYVTLTNGNTAAKDLTIYIQSKTPGKTTETYRQYKQSKVLVSNSITTSWTNNKADAFKIDKLNVTSTYLYVYLTETTPPTAKINLLPNGGTGGGTIETKQGKTVSLSNSSVTVPVRAGYTFKGWNENANGSGRHYAVNTTITPYSDVTLYAEWTRTANLVTGPIGKASVSSVVYNYDADGTAYRDGVPAEPLEVSIDVRKVAHWTALGWTKDPNSTTADYTPEFEMEASYLDSASTDFYAIAERDLLVSYDGNGETSGSAPAAQGDGKQVYNASARASITSGIDTFTVKGPGDLAKEGCVFTGWNTEADGSGKSYAVGARIKIGEPTTLYAQWAYGVTYDENGGKPGTAPSGQMKLPGANLTLHSGKPSRDPDTEDITTTLDYNYDGAPAATEKKTKRSEAWTFKEWNTASDGSGDTYAPGASYTADEAVTLYAQWQVQNPVYASTALPTPTREGYDFLGWTAQADPTEEELAAAYEGGATYTPTSDGTLYAQWKAKTYELTYKENGDGVTGMPDPDTVEKTHGVDLPLSSATPARQETQENVTLTLNYKGGAYFAGADDGAWASDSTKTEAITTTYSFQGWNKSSFAATGSYAAGGSYTDNAPATLYAIWKPETSGYGTYKLPDASRTSVTSVTYTFKGWTTAEHSSKKFDEIPSGALWEKGADFGPVTEDTTLYAVWDPPTYAIEYDGNGGDDTVADVPAAQNKEADEAGFRLQSGVPQRQAAKGEFTVSYDANGGSVAAEDANTKATNGVTYTFDKWTTQADGSGDAYNPGDEYTANADVKLYAQWVESGELGSVTLPTPTRDGYTFQGWHTAATGGEKAGDAGDSYTPSGDITLYAQWKANEYTVTYDDNAPGATVANMPDPTSVTKIHDVTLTLSDKEPSRADETGAVAITYDVHGGSTCAAGSSNFTSTYDFLSWKADDGVSYAPESAYKANASTTLKADWAEETEYDTIVLPETTWEGHTFLGWFTAETGGDKVGDAGDEYTPAAKGAVTLHAQWEVHTYPISYDMNTDDTVGNEPDPNPDTKTHDVVLMLAGAPTRANTVTDQFTVSFDGRGGTNVPAPIESDATIKHEFTGWNSNADGTGDAYEAGGSYAANEPATLYAQWKDEAVGAELTLPAGPTPPAGSYTFMGWSADKNADPADSSLLQPGDKVAPSGDITYYAIYDPPIYVVRYDANGGASAPDDQYKKHDEDLDLSSDTPTRDEGAPSSYEVTYNPAGGSAARTSDSATATSSYEFVGWAEDALVGADPGIVTDSEWAAYAAAKKHAPGSSYTANADLDLFAQWKETVTSDPATVQLPSADRPGYTFLGWYDQDGNRVGGAGDDYVLPGEETELVAKWKNYDYPSDSEAFAYVVVFEYDDGTEIATQDFTFGESQALNAGTLTAPAGKVFAGWQLKDGSSTFTEHQLVSNLTNEPDGKVYLVATWKDAPSGGSGGGGTDPDPDNPNPDPDNPNGYNFYTVEYWEQGTDGVMYKKESTDKVFEDAGESVEVPPSALDAPLGFHVDWDETVDSGTVEDDNSTTLSVYWARNQFDVEFQKGAADATGTMGDQHFVWASGDKLNPNAFSRPGYTFTGWKVTERDGSLAAQSIGGLGTQSVVVVVALTTQALGNVTLTTQALGNSVADKADGSRLTWTDAADGGHVTLTAQWVRDSSSDPDNPGGPDGPNGPSDPDDPNDPDGPSDPADPDGPDGPGGTTDPDGPNGPDRPSGPTGSDSTADPDDPDNPDNLKKELEKLIKEAEDVIGPIAPEGPTALQKELLDAMDAAKALLADPDATADQLRDGIARLSDAIAACKDSGALPRMGDPMMLVGETLALLLLAATGALALRLRNRSAYEAANWAGSTGNGTGRRRRDTSRGKHAR